MKRDAYIGHETQLFGVEEMRLVGGKGDGMRLLQVRNGLGIELTVVADRAADISRFSFRGDNFGWFSAVGYSAPAFYGCEAAAGWLRSFTGGFLTTCGLTNVGAAGEDDGEELAFHGRISNTPAERVSWDMDEKSITIRAVVREAQALGKKLVFSRSIVCSKTENKVTIGDNIKNIDGVKCPLMVLYHMNMGYPLLSEQSLLYIPSNKVTPRTKFAAEGLSEWDRVTSPKAGIEEQCYFHSFGREGVAAIFSPIINSGVKICFDTEKLDHFTQWKNMGAKDYVLGLEPGNCYPEGRKALKENGELKYLQPGEAVDYTINITVLESADDWRALTANLNKEKY